MHIKRKKYSYNFCQECGRPLTDPERCGRIKFCSELCRLVTRRRRNRERKKMVYARRMNMANARQYLLKLRVEKRLYRKLIKQKNDDTNNTKSPPTVMG